VHQILFLRTCGADFEWRKWEGIGILELGLLQTYKEREGLIYFTEGKTKSWSGKEAKPQEKEKNAFTAANDVDQPQPQPEKVPSKPVKIFGDYFMDVSGNTKDLSAWKILVSI